ncbi:hypothetical protein [Streptomyces sp. CB01580]|uniref:hypothetical protein n=1 Tax=Streptomyces sp. CB01580 TaxID=1703933 RepID=UPI0018FE1FAA|nr:hypothetical protein [Streptomyces sp. CB01580]
MTDDVSDQVGHELMEALCRTHAADPQALAHALTAAAEAAEEGYRDDATVIAMAGAPVSPRPGKPRGLIGLRGSEELLQCRGVQEVDPGHAVGQGTSAGGQQVGCFAASGEHRAHRGLVSPA